MGQGYQFKCKCGYSFTPFLGVGFMFPKEYQDLKEAAVKGELGEEIKTFFSEHPEGAIDAAKVVVRCQKCGKYEIVPNLPMYLPLEGEEHVTPWDLQESYKLYARYPHKCESCGGDMDIVSEEDLLENGIICPECGKPIKCDPDDVIMWD